MVGRFHVPQSTSPPHSNLGDDANSRSSEGQRILADLQTLRGKIVAAWQERGVVLTPEEQEELRDEIRVTAIF